MYVCVSTCGICVLVCSAMILSLWGDCTSSEWWHGCGGSDFTENWHTRTLSYHLLKDGNFCTLVCQWRFAVARFLTVAALVAHWCSLEGGEGKGHWDLHFLTGGRTPCLALACQNWSLWAKATEYRTNGGPNSVEQNWRKFRPKCVANGFLLFLCARMCAAVMLTSDFQRKYRRTTIHYYHSGPLHSLWHQRVRIVPGNCSVLNLPNKRLEYCRAVGGFIR